MAANKSPRVVELSPKLCMPGSVLKRTCTACSSHGQVQCPHVQARTPIGLRQP